MEHPLITENVHFYPKQNAKSHHTDKFEDLNPPSGDPRATIVRRGRPFTGVLTFNRPYDEKHDVVRLRFTLGSNKPHIDAQGSVFIKKDVTPEKFSWSAEFMNLDKKFLVFSVLTPVDAPVGFYELEVVTEIKKSDAKKTFKFKDDLYILFNPWNPDDQTYMVETELLQEYVLTDVGKIWMGPSQNPTWRPWVFGQFDKDVLPAIMYMLDKIKVPYQHRGDVVKMSRYISAAVNSNDDYGVVIGNWTGNYENGTSPSAWTGSVDILEKYVKTKAPVPYGQCWVFAGVVATVCRALGIPCRVVTNLDSAHDINGSLTIDKFYSEKMDKEIYHHEDGEGNRKDSIWNYHVWNDAWMARPDLPLGYGGWQAIDATPQEKSFGKYQCGPAPLEAIKRGITGLSYDVDFLLATVNADIVYWKKDPKSETGFTVAVIDKTYVGKNILTQKPFAFDPHGYSDLEDITTQYKYSEGTSKERLVVENSVQNTRRKRQANIGKNDVSFKLKNIDTVQIGQEFSVVVDVKNNSRETRHIKATLSASSIYYNGVKAQLVKDVIGQFQVGPDKEEKLHLKVFASDYMPKLVEYCNMKIFAMANVVETEQAWAGEDNFHFIKPFIIIKFMGDVVVDQPATVTFSLENPLEHSLTGCELRVSSSGIAGRTLQLPTHNVGPRQHMHAQLPVYPNKLGTLTLVATFNSVELQDIKGSASVQVRA